MNRDGCSAARHGDRNAYRKGCRCTDARRDHTRSLKEYRLRVLHDGLLLIPAIGTRRRLQALQVIGYSQSDLAFEMGCRTAGVRQMLRPTHNLVTRASALRVVLLYERLSDLPNPRADVRTLHRAAKQKWLAPIWWDDDTIDNPDFRPVTKEVHGFLDHVLVERAMVGTLPGHSPTKRQARRVAALELRRSGLTEQQVADRMRLSARTIDRYYAEDREPCDRTKEAEAS